MYFYQNQQQTTKSSRKERELREVRGDRMLVRTGQSDLVTLCIALGKVCDPVTQVQ